MQALILAAGYGTRLKPYTDSLPKPMFPVGGVPLIVSTIETLKKAGVTDFFINLHHLPPKISNVLGDGAKLGVHIRYSHEPQILGTGGAIRKLKRELSAEKDFLLVNADMLFDLDLPAAIKFHERNEAAATMLLYETALAANYGAVNMDAAGHVSGFEPKGSAQLQGKKDLIFTGIHVISGKIFELLPDKDFFCIVHDVYKPNLTSNKIFSFKSTGTWQDIGNPEEYLQANFAWLEKNPQAVDKREYPGCTIVPPASIGLSTTIGAGSVVGPYTIVGKNCEIGKNCRLSRCVVWDKAAVKDGTELQDGIITA